MSDQALPRSLTPSSRVFGSSTIANRSVQRYGIGGEASTNGTNWWASVGCFNLPGFGSSATISESTTYGMGHRIDNICFLKCLFIHAHHASAQIPEL